MKNYFYPVLFLLFCGLLGMSAAYALNLSIGFLSIFGLVIGSVPLGFSILKSDFNILLLTERICLGLIVVVAISLAFYGIIPVINDQTLNFEPTIPLLLLSLILYVLYLRIHRVQFLNAEGTVTDFLKESFSGPPAVLSLAMGAVLSCYSLFLLEYLQSVNPDWAYISAKFTDRGIIPPLIVAMFFWGMIILSSKFWILLQEFSTLLSQDYSKGSLLLGVQESFLPKKYNGRHLEMYFETLYSKSNESYALSRYLNWAVPILGFIGTVLGISLAADGIQSIISSDKGVSEFSGQLGQAIAPLGIAFDTTLVALSLSMFMMLIQTMLQKWEDSILSDYKTLLQNQL